MNSEGNSRTILSFILFELQGKQGVNLSSFQEEDGEEVETALLYNRSGTQGQLQKRGVRKSSVFRAASSGFWEDSGRRKKIKKKGKAKVRFFQVIEKTEQIIAGATQPGVSGKAKSIISRRNIYSSHVFGML